MTEKLSDSKNYKSFLREKELITWLGHHNRGVGEKFQNRADGRQYTRELYTGLATDRNAEREIESLVNFVAPNPADRRIGCGLPSHEDRKAQRVRESVEKVLQNKMSKENYEAGMNPVTLMAAHRRKIILQALTDSREGIGESRDFCKDKVKQYLEEVADRSTPSISSTSLTPIPANRRGNESSRQRSKIKSFGLIINTDGHVDDKIDAQRAQDLNGEESTISDAIHSASKPKKSKIIILPLPSPSPKSGLERDVDAPFVAKWDSYDTMRCRWRYIKPQTKSLTNDVEAPVSGDVVNQYLTGDSSEKIYGGVNNLLEYTKLTRGSMSRKQRISAISENMVEKALLKREHVYKPDTYVTY